MRTKIYGTDINDMLLESEYPRFFQDTSEILTERSFTAEMFLGKGSYKEIFFDGIHIGYGDMSLANDTIFLVEDDRERIEMNFSLSGNTFVDTPIYNNIVNIKTGYHNIFYAKEFKAKVSSSSKIPLQTLEINMVPSFFLKYLPEEYDIFSKLRKCIDKKESSMLSKKHFAITKEMYFIISQIINCNRTGIYKRMFLESKVIELLLLQLEQINSESEDRSIDLKKQDIDKMYAVKEILDTDFKGNHTLLELAHSVGTNEFMLKKGFKELFGTTVFGYWNDLRMKTAKIMLQDEGLSVQEVSRKIVYKNPQHFTTAFKKQFGVPPSYLKR